MRLHTMRHGRRLKLGTIISSSFASPQVIDLITSEVMPLVHECGLAGRAEYATEHRMFLEHPRAAQVRYAVPGLGVCVCVGGGDLPGATFIPAVGHWQLEEGGSWFSKWRLAVVGQQLRGGMLAFMAIRCLPFSSHGCPCARPASMAGLICLELGIVGGTAVSHINGVSYAWLPARALCAAADGD